MSYFCVFPPLHTLKSIKYVYFYKTIYKTRLFRTKSTCSWDLAMTSQFLWYAPYPMALINVAAWDKSITEVHITHLSKTVTFRSRGDISFKPMLGEWVFQWRHIPDNRLSCSFSLSEKGLHQPKRASLLRQGQLRYNWVKVIPCQLHPLEIGGNGRESPETFNNVLNHKDPVQ